MEQQDNVSGARRRRGSDWDPSAMLEPQEEERVERHGFYQHPLLGCLIPLADPHRENQQRTETIFQRYVDQVAHDNGGILAPEYLLDRHQLRGGYHHSFYRDAKELLTQTEGRDRLRAPGPGDAAIWSFDRTWWNRIRPQPPGAAPQLVHCLEWAHLSFTEPDRWTVALTMRDPSGCTTIQSHETPEDAVESLVASVQRDWLRVERPTAPDRTRHAINFTLEWALRARDRALGRPLGSPPLDPEQEWLRNRASAYKPAI
ncbi:hypothetical protein [Thioalkalivibrio sp. ALE16]|uniref:hypothetical protein n=1 Tax=Thioalkalivibrio sp. ALE16 TaxID=1158172 RepID=UPI000381C2BB|nr:hypothetical protein [Thioalkalivibrio sp. ALE16]